MIMKAPILSRRPLEHSGGFHELVARASETSCKPDLNPPKAGKILAQDTIKRLLFTYFALKP